MEKPPPQIPPMAKPARTFSKGFRNFIVGLAILVCLSALAGSLFHDRLEGSARKIGVVEVMGVITDSRDIIRQLRELNDDASILAPCGRAGPPGLPRVAPAR